ncbi:MAG: zf-HC2 domain-containing protein [Sedimentisphaerales bacterium]
MNKHDKISKLLAGSALGELSPEAQAEVKTHLAECHQCSSELKRLQTLLECTGRIRELSPDARMCESARQALFAAVESGKNQPSPKPNPGPELIWRTIMYNRTMKLAAAAVIAMVVLGGISFWPGGNPQNGKWWLGPPAAWGQEIMAELEKIEALVYRSQSVFVGGYGSTHVSGTWRRNYEAKDRSREDQYYEHTDEDTFGPSNPDSILQHVSYKVPDGQDLISYGVSYEHQCYTIRTNEGGAYQRDPMGRLRSYVNQLDKADRILDMATFEDRECVGFEIDTSKYEDNPEGRIDRIWFDVQTKLPIRIERHGRPITSRPGETFTHIQDQFEYYAQVPAEMFEPEIPEDFINAEPSEVHAAKEKQEKGQMLYADVPAGLKDDIAAALKGVKTAVYRESGGEWIYISEYDWRKDSYLGDQLRKAVWYVTYKADWGKTSLDFNDRNFRLIQTTVNFADRSYKEITHDSRSHPDNPMDRIISLAGYIDRADRFFESQQIEGIECFGFELSAKKYGSNPDTNIHTLWFDAVTMLPVKMEFDWLQDDGPKKRVLDQFEWNPDLPVETFIPEIPADFTLEANSDG